MKSVGTRIMRTGIFIISSLLLLVLFSIGAVAVNWNNPESQSVDQMIAGDSSGASWPSGEYPGPQASRAAQAGKDNKDIISLPVGGHLPSDATNPQQARSEETNQINSNKQVVTKTTEPVQPMASSDTTSVTGSWSLELNDNASWTAALALFQSGDAVYGTGYINLDSTTVAKATASGTIVGDKLSLDVVSLGQVSLYRISMTLSGDSATGSYTAYRPGTTPSIRGTATGLRSATQS